MSLYGVNKVSHLLQVDPEFRDLMATDPATALAALPLLDEERNAILTSGSRGLSGHRRGWPKIMRPISCLPSARRYSNTWFSIILIGIIRLTIL